MAGSLIGAKADCLPRARGISPEGRSVNLTALLRTAAVERDYLALAGLLHRLFWDFLGNAEKTLAPLHLGPDLVGPYAGGNPENRQVVKQIGALPHHRLAVAMHRIDHHFDGFLGELLRHFRPAGTQEPGGAR